MPPKTAPWANSSNLVRTTTLSGYGNIDFTPDAMRDVDGNGPRVAGLLNLPNVVELHRLMSSKCPNTRKVLKDFTEDRLAQFGTMNYLAVDCLFKGADIDYIYL
ncbi:unnamed protein product [Penicillium viridicatum]